MKKKALLITFVLVTVIAIAGCKPNWTKDPNTYYSSISNTANMNPYSETLNDSSTLYGYLTDALYEADFDWEEAIANDVADAKGDFSNTAALGYNYYPSMASKRPVPASGTENNDKLTSKELYDKVWTINLKSDLVFEDGTPINADTFVQSWKYLLDPKLNNARAVNLYSSTSGLPVEGAEAYYRQGKARTENGAPIYLDGANEVKYVLDTHSIVEVDGEDVFIFRTLDKKENGDPIYATSDSYQVNLDGSPVLVDGVKVLISEGLKYVWASSFEKLGKDDVAEAGDSNRYGDGEKPTGLSETKNYPAATWESVGIKKIDNLSFKITLTVNYSQWDVMSYLASATVGVVHLEKYAAGLRDGGSSTTYGTIDNPLVSYGPYKLDTWQDGVVYAFSKNDKFHAKDNYRIGAVRLSVIANQQTILNEYKAGRLDVAGVGGEFYADYASNPLLKLSPTTTTFRLAFNIGGRSDGKKQNPILADADFRKALYLAIDRDEFASEVRPPSEAQQGYISNIYKGVESAENTYRESEPGQNVFKDLYPNTSGYNSTEAKRLFDQAYNAAVAAGKIASGSKVVVDYVMYEVDSNRKVAEWVKSTTENIFGDKFEFNIVGLSDAGIDAAWDNKDFDLTFGGWTGMIFNPAELMAIVYNHYYPDYILENGFETGELEVLFPLSTSGQARAQDVYEDFVVGMGLDPDVDDADKVYEVFMDAFNKYVGGDASYAGVYQNGYYALVVRDILDSIVDGVVTATVDTAGDFASAQFAADYADIEADANEITAAIELALLNEMISIPLITSRSAAIYSERVVFEVPEYHAVMGWGGFTYMYLSTAE
ncbi:ABC transporter substrate-binding protein [Acholeplasma sp. OttesenSCG-928-E16]|nr:ABC transporter substrate-binding protein [Acholeplasma sp. OttesenSCG-928-E16]